MARQSLVEYFAEYARHGGDIAVASRRGYRMERWDYARISNEACRFARELEARGIAPGNAVLFWAENSPEWVAAFWGCVLRGAVVVPIDRIATSEFARRVAQEVNAKLLLRSRAIPETEVAVPSLPIESLSEVIARHSAAAYASPPLGRKDILEIVFTSGTTAEPRGVVISHGNVLANIEPLEHEIKKYLRYERFVHPLRFLNLLPLSHVFGQMLALFLPPLLGGTVVFLDSFKPSELTDTIRRERISVLVAVPRLIESLERDVERHLEGEGLLEKFRADFREAEGKHFFRRWWRFHRIHNRLGWKFWAFISGGAALPEKTEMFWNRLGYAVIQGYGLTETTSLVSLNHPFRLGKGSIGKLFPGLEMRVDASGEILVRGENIAAGYWRGQSLHPVVGEDGWFHTGDLAAMDESGQLYFKGRQKNVIVTPAGMNIFPEDLEAALRRQKGVKDCVVFGIERDGNAEPCAVLLLENRAADAKSLIDSANQSLAEYQQIRRWLVWPEADFPRTATQKPFLPRIREVAEAKSAPSPAQSDHALANLVAHITGRPRDSHSSNAGLETELNLSSLDRVELMSALEDRYQVNLSEVKFSEARTVGQLDQLLRESPVSSSEQAYPRWAQNWFITGVRLAAYYLLVWPATYLVAAPRVRGLENLLKIRGPVLVISNHVTDIDIGWILAALPARFRHRLATAMGGERLASMHHPSKDMNKFARILQRMGYFLVVMLFNVFPLPKASGFLKSFSFAGDLADRGWNILIFPEGQTTQTGRLVPFRAGIGLLATRLNIPVVPIRLDGLFEMKQAHRKFARPGGVRVTIGEPVRFSPNQDPEEIARELEHRVEKLGTVS